MKYFIVLLVAISALSCKKNHDLQEEFPLSHPKPILEPDSDFHNAKHGPYICPRGFYGKDCELNRGDLLLGSWQIYDSCIIDKCKGDGSRDIFAYKFTTDIIKENGKYYIKGIWGSEYGKCNIFVESDTIEIPDKNDLPNYFAGGKPFANIKEGSPKVETWNPPADKYKTYIRFIKQTDGSYLFERRVEMFSTVDNYFYIRLRKI